MTRLGDDAVALARIVRSAANVTPGVAFEQFIAQQIVSARDQVRDSPRLPLVPKLVDKRPTGEGR